MYLPLAIFASFAFLYSILAGRLEKTPISGPVVFITFGLLVGPLGAGWLQLDVTSTELRVLADLVLALVLFSDAASVNKVVLKSGLSLPLRMLLIGLPGVIAAGFLAAWLMFDSLTLWEMAILATMLSATDAALGKTVVTSKAVPANIRMALNVESGLNDGICVPILFLFIALATADAGSHDTTALAVQLVATEIGIGLFAGLSVTAVGIWFIFHAWRQGWITDLWGQLTVTMLALTCFAVAQSLHGSGYIAAFVGGLLFGYIARRRAHELILDTEGTGETLGMLTWILFGSVVIPEVIDHFTWRIFGYAVLSLTVIRMLPVLLSLVGTRENIGEKLFMAWFGPRGLASIVFAIIVLNQNIDGAGQLAVIVSCTVLLSAVIHGITAVPFTLLLNRCDSEES